MTQAFEDVIDNPEAVVRMMDFALEFNIFLQERVRLKCIYFADEKWNPRHTIRSRSSTNRQLVHL